VAETESHAPDWCLSSEADSHQTKAPIGGRESEAGLPPAKGIRRQPPATGGRRASERWDGGPGCYGVSPLEWVAPHEVGAWEKLFPQKADNVTTDRKRCASGRRETEDFMELAIGEAEFDRERV
jgi:hypothetical protein